VTTAQRSRVLAGLSLSLLLAVLLVGVSVRRSRQDPVDTRFVNGTHVAFLFVAPTGPGSDALVSAVHAMRNAVRDAAKEAGVPFTTIGIADDWSVRNGLESLARFGPFDEVDVGRNVFNLGLRRYVFDVDGPRAVPQVIVARENFRMQRETSPFVGMEIVSRHVGVAEIMNWHAEALQLSR
jgi:hypothetical protein